MTTKPAEFPHPYVAVDVLVFSIRDGSLQLLLIKRSRSPFAGQFAIPGTFAQLDETLDAAAKRALQEKAKLNNTYLEQLYTFGEIDRDPRGRVISVTYFALVPFDKIKDSSDKQHVIKWYPVKNLPDLAFDHKQIVAAGLERLRAKIGYSTIAVGLLPAKFRLTELQNVYEIILDKSLDKRNFRKKMLSLGLLENLREKILVGTHRPAALFSFKTRQPVIFD